MLSLWLAIKKYSWPVSTKRLFVDITGYSVWCLYKKVSYPPIFLVIFSISENDKLTWILQECPEIKMFSNQWVWGIYLIHFVCDNTFKQRQKTDKENQNSFIRAIFAICNDGNSI